MKMLEAIAIPQNQRLFAHFLHEGKIHAFAKTTVPSWEEQFRKVITAILKS
jgi:hypothetical protein